MSDTRNLGRKQRELLLELEESVWMLRDLGRVVGRFQWAQTGKIEDPRTVMTLWQRELVTREPDAGRQRIVLTRAGLAYVAKYWRERADARQDMLTAWRKRCAELEQRIKELGG